MRDMFITFTSPNYSSQIKHESVFFFEILERTYSRPLMVIAVGLVNLIVDLPKKRMNGFGQDGIPFHV